jgi:hypothetical protein
MNTIGTIHIGGNIHIGITIITGTGTIKEGMSPPAWHAGLYKRPVVFGGYLEKYPRGAGWEILTFDPWRI